ncbi:MAG TPA: NAD(P)-binding protein [Burkholderiaceae bacterium]|nr:NAD(P)-binding protein [Burkholderiaceae bacterium]
MRIVGGGISGLTTAIVLARGGARVEVFERGLAGPAMRPVRWDAVENWTTREDLAELLARWAIDATPFRTPRAVEVIAFDGECHPLRGARPLLYLVKRGAAHDSLDACLRRHAVALGVRMRLGETLPRECADVWAVGMPRRGFFLDAGITFRTTQPDRVAILVDHRVTPKACAYLIVADGIATLAVLLTRQFKRARRLLDAAVDAFQRERPFDMFDVRLQSGFGGGVRALRAQGVAPIVVGEAAGFLDYLWGFGIRYAMSSGVLAAHALLEGGDYRALVAREVAPLVHSSLVNRKLYDWTGNQVCRALIRLFCTRRDPHALLQRFYQSRRARSIFLPWATHAIVRDMR